MRFVFRHPRPLQHLHIVPADGSNSFRRREPSPTSQVQPHDLHSSELSLFQRDIFPAPAEAPPPETAHGVVSDSLDEPLVPRDVMFRVSSPRSELVFRSDFHFRNDLVSLASPPPPSSSFHEGGDSPLRSAFRLHRPTAKVEARRQFMSAIESVSLFKFRATSMMV